MIAPLGAGKTVLARRVPTMLPDLTLEEAIETTKLHSVAGPNDASYLWSKVQDVSIEEIAKLFSAPSNTLG